MTSGCVLFLLLLLFQPNKSTTWKEQHLRYVPVAVLNIPGVSGGFSKSNTAVRFIVAFLNDGFSLISCMYIHVFYVFVFVFRFPLFCFTPPFGFIRLEASLFVLRCSTVFVELEALTRRNSKP